MNGQGGNAFSEYVLRWLREVQHVSATSVEKVDGRGTDWCGSTEGGFYSQFDVDIRYTDEGGAVRTKSVEGEEMASLWSWVVGAWPT